MKDNLRCACTGENKKASLWKRTGKCDEVKTFVKQFLQRLTALSLRTSAFSHKLSIRKFCFRLTGKGFYATLRISPPCSTAHLHN